jgi:hypothetical protein
VWKDKREVYMLTNINKPAMGENSHDEKKNASKPLIMECYNVHMGNVDQSN